MKFGGLSEGEVKEIIKILETESIEFYIEEDEDIASFNERSIKNNLRHLSPPNLSTHILSIYIEDHDLEMIPDKGKERLLVFGITNLVPKPEDLKAFTGETFHRNMADAPKTIIGASFFHQTIYGVILVLLAFAVKIFLN